jgi:hypothetical protein
VQTSEFITAHEVPSEKYAMQLYDRTISFLKPNAMDTIMCARVHSCAYCETKRHGDQHALSLQE